MINICSILKICKNTKVVIALMEKLLSKINNIVKQKFEKCGYDREYGMVTVSNRPDLSQYQCNGALAAAKKYRKSPIQIANNVLEELNSVDEFEKVFIAGPGFINIVLKDSFLISYINEMCNSPKLGCPQTEKPETIIIDYGGANVAKPLHVGHLRTAIIGETLKRMGKFLGNKVIGDIHMGDWGLQMGMIITEMKKRQGDLPYFDENYTGEYPKEAPFTVDELNEIYPAANRRCKGNEADLEEARNATFELQNGRRGYVALWRHIIDVSVADLKKNYKSLNVDFDLWNGESDSTKYIDKAVDYLKKNNYVQESEGALVVDVSTENDTHPVPPFMIYKSDGATLYSTTDLATIWGRVEEYAPDDIIYVVDNRQCLHFEQLFRCVRKTKIVKDSLKLEFIGFGTMNGKDGKPYKTREGGVMKLENLIKTVKNKVLEKLKENRPDVKEEEMNEIADKVGLSALKYGDLSNQISKNYVFDIDRFCSFEGNTGPYILYTVVRAKSILRKAESEGLKAEGKILEPQSEIERDLMLKLAKFGEVIEGSFEDRTPNRICEYIYDVSNQFNKFYHENKIITEEDQNKKMSWINLTAFTKKILETCLDILGIEAPERM